MTRTLLPLLLLLSAGCAAPTSLHRARIASPLGGPAAAAAGSLREKGIVVEARPVPPCHFTDLTAFREEGAWYLSGRIIARCCLIHSTWTLRVEALDRNGKVVDRSRTEAKVLHADTWRGDRSRGAFRLPIPAPTEFERLFLVQG